MDTHTSLSGRRYNPSRLPQRLRHLSLWSSDNRVENILRLRVHKLINSFIGSFIVVGSALVAPLAPTPVYAQSFISNNATQALVDQSQADLLGIKIEEVAKKYKISSTTLANLVDSESEGNPYAEGDHGCSYGLAQINICAHKEVSKEDALDSDFALSYAAEAISEGTEDAWSVCNCYSYVQANFVRNLPRMADIQVNTNVPKKGNVAIFWYKDKKTGADIKHIAYVVDSKGTIKEANKEHCKTSTRLIPNNDPHLAGYFDPTVL